MPVPPHAKCNQPANYSKFGRCTLFSILCDSSQGPWLWPEVIITTQRPHVFERSRRILLVAAGIQPYMSAADVQCPLAQNVSATDENVCFQSCMHTCARLPVLCHKFWSHAVKICKGRAGRRPCTDAWSQWDHISSKVLNR